MPTPCWSATTRVPAACHSLRLLQTAHPSCARCAIWLTTRSCGTVWLDQVLPCGLVTTPQLHWMVRQRNAGLPSTEQDYVDTLLGAFATVTQDAPAPQEVCGTWIMKIERDHEYFQHNLQKGVFVHRNNKLCTVWSALFRDNVLTCLPERFPHVSPIFLHVSPTFHQQFSHVSPTILPRVSRPAPAPGLRQWCGRRQACGHDLHTGPCGAVP